MIISFSIFGLIFNIWTLSVNEQILKINHGIKKLREENKGLELTIIQKKSIENLDKIAKEKLLMTPTQKIYYIEIPTSRNVQ